MLSDKLKFLSCVIVGLFSVDAFALIGNRNLEDELRHESICIPAPLTGTSTAGNGLDGLIFKTTINGISAPTSTASNAGAPSSFPWPAKLAVDLLDSAATADTLTCTSVVIKGKDQFGRSIGEMVSTVSETAQNTSNVFSTVSSVVGAGCAGASDAGDVLVVYQSQEVGLTRKIRAAADLEAVCLADRSDSGTTKCARLDNGGSDDISSALELSSNSIDLSVAMFGQEGSEVAAAADDLVCLRVRSSKTAR